jgi:hypothetical protein
MYRKHSQAPLASKWGGQEKEIKMTYFKNLILMLWMGCFLSSAPLKERWVKIENLPAIFESLQQQAKRSALHFETKTIGYSVLGQPIWHVALGNPKAEKQVLWVCGQHGDEPDSVQACLYLLQDISQNPALQKWLTTAQFHMVPLLNPDGYQRRTRKNSRGVNLNANWGWGWQTPLSDSVSDRFKLASGTSFRGPTPFSEPETQVLKTFLEGHHFQMLVDYHTGVASFSQGMVLYPFTHAMGDALTPTQRELLYPLALEQSQALSVSSVSNTDKDPVLAFQNNEVLPYLQQAIRQHIPEKYHAQALSQLPKSMQSPGSLIDWAFGAQGIPALAFEMYFPVDDLSEARIHDFNVFYQQLQPGLHRSVIHMLQSPVDK